MLFAGASFERSVSEAPSGVARVPGITRTRRKHLGEPTRRVHAPCATGRAFPVADRSLTSRCPHQAPPIDFVRPEAPARRDLAITPNRRTCWARIPREPSGEGENQRRPGDACNRTREPEAFAPDSRSRAPSMTDVVREPHTRSLETLCPPLPRQRRWRVGTELARAPERSPCDFPWTTNEDAACRPLLSETTTSTHPSSISLRRPRMTCATHAVPGEPGVSRHRNPPEGIRSAVREAFPPPRCPWTVLRAPLSQSPFEVPTFARKRRDATPRWQRTLVETAEIASAVDP